MKVSHRMQTREIALYGIYTSIFLFMGLTPFIGFIPIGPFKISIMLIPVVIMTLHLKIKGAFIGGILFGMVSFLNGIIYGSILINWVGGVWQWFIVSWFSRLLLGLLLALIVYVFTMMNNKIYFNVIAITISALLLNFILFLGFYIPFSGKEFWVVLGSGGINLAIETPIDMIIVLGFIPILKIINQRKYEGL